MALSMQNKKEKNIILLVIGHQQYNRHVSTRVSDVNELRIMVLKTDQHCQAAHGGRCFHAVEQVNVWL